MLLLALQLVLAPALVGLATLASRSSGPRIGGLVGAYPAIVGPVLLIDAHAHGPAFAARAAGGTLLGLLALSAFAVVYGRVALRAGWVPALAAAWAVAAVTGALAAEIDAGPPVAFAIALLSLAAAHRALPRRSAIDRGALATPGRDLAARMTLTIVLVALLALAAGPAGPVAGGVLAALPVLASILAAFTHRRHGPEAAVGLLRGMLAGMAGFAIFCLLVAVLVQGAGVVPAFAAAAAAGAVAAAAVAAGLPRTPARAASASGMTAPSDLASRASAR